MKQRNENKISSINEYSFNSAVKKLRVIAKIIPDHITDDEDSEVLQVWLLDAIKELERSRVDLPILELRPHVVNQD